MLILPFVPPQPVSTTARHGFDYVTADAARRRVYAGHGGNSSLLIVDADTGKVLGQVHLGGGPGGVAGVAVDAADGHVFTGDGDNNAISEVDPVAMKEVHRVAVAGHVDAIAYDPKLHRIYGDEDDGTRIFVIDSRTFKQIGTVALPGHKPEYLAIDPKTHVVYQNIATNSEIAVVDPKTLKVVRTIPTPEIANNHPLQIDIDDGTLLVGGKGKLSLYTLRGKHLATVSMPARVDQCTFDDARHMLACAANSSLVLYKVAGKRAPVEVGIRKVARGMHTVGVDFKTGRFWVVWGTPSGDFVQGFVYR
ncbi:MAG: YncE family protein [Candidatus Baltobacteraceae bacterium]